MFVRYCRAAVELACFGSLATPVRTAGGGIKRLAPDEANTACRGCELCYFPTRDPIVELGEEVFGYLVFACLPVFFRRYLSFATLGWTMRFLG